MSSSIEPSIAVEPLRARINALVNDHHELQAQERVLESQLQDTRAGQQQIAGRIAALQEVIMEAESASVVAPSDAEISDVKINGEDEPQDGAPQE
jgi:hypothetical protein